MEQQGHAVIDTGMARSALTQRGIQQAKQGHTLGPTTMTLFYTTDFADRLENEIIPALRAGFVVLTDRYIFSIMARAIARGQDRKWIEQVAGIALVPHAIYYLRAEIDDLVARVVVGRGSFEYWESGMDIPIGRDRYESFIKYQQRVIKALDEMAERYDFTRIDATKRPDQIFRLLQRSIKRIIAAMKERSTASIWPSCKRRSGHPLQACISHHVGRQKCVRGPSGGGASPLARATWPLRFFHETRITALLSRASAVEC